MASALQGLHVSLDPRTLESAVGRAKVRTIEADGSLVLETEYARPLCPSAQLTVTDQVQIKHSRRLSREYGMNILEGCEI